MSALPGQEAGLQPLVNDDYILMPGDSVVVMLTGATNYSYITGITYEGRILINLPVGPVSASTSMFQSGPAGFSPGLQYTPVDAVAICGLNLSAARDSLDRVFRRYFRGTRCGITLLAVRTTFVSVVGEVSRPGIYKPTPLHHVSAVIDTAGGTTTFGSRSRIELRRAGKLYQIVNLDSFARTGDFGTNPTVLDGDVILVPRMIKAVVVKGAVFGKGVYRLQISQLTAERERISEGLYELNDGERVSDMISKAGGLTPWADFGNAYVERAGGRIKLELDSIIADEQSEYNIRLQDKDALVLASVRSFVYVSGQVVNPTSYTYLPNLRASDYIGLAGGPLEGAEINGAYVVRGKKRLAARADPVIEAGDRIFVPKQVFKFWQDYVEIGSVVASLFLSYLTFRIATGQ